MSKNKGTINQSNGAICPVERQQVTGKQLLLCDEEVKRNLSEYIKLLSGWSKRLPGCCPGLETEKRESEVTNETHQKK